jgi:choline dehydrogenase-like flavoprotein
MSSHRPSESGALAGTRREYDAVVVGSGFGAAFAALPLVRAGARVLMLERGPWVTRGPWNWEAQGSFDLTPYKASEVPFRVRAGGVSPVMHGCSCVGGASVFYGGVSFRLRTHDFEPRDEYARAGAAWPLRYPDLEPYYAKAEEILGVGGEAGADPSEPPRSGPYPHAAAPLSPTSRLIAGAARSCGLTPFPLPLAINHTNGPRVPCQSCPTCDTFACAVSAKNDVATAVLPELLRRGLELRPRTLVTGLKVRGGRIAEVEAVDTAAGRRVSFRTGLVLLGAGALSSPHLILASGLAARNPAGDAVGGYLTRHCVAIVYGLFPRLPDEGQLFHKQVGFHALDSSGDRPAGPDRPVGSIQQVQSPPVGLVRARLPVSLNGLVPALVKRATGLLALAEDEPRAENRVSIDRQRTDHFGLPQMVVTYRESRRDERARDALSRRARAVLREAGAVLFYRHVVKTFSHAAGTVRFGEDARKAPLDPWCRFRGLSNLFVVDASALPTSGAVNPSLTIAANALRVGTRLAKECEARLGQEKAA